MSRAFYRTYRPQKFSDLFGQDLIRLTLSQAVIEDRVSNAYLFSGPRGTGKTTTARIMAKAINCTTALSKRKNGDPCDECENCLLLSQGKTLDLVEIDAASYTGVDNIRQLTENIDLSPAKLKFRVFIIDEVHMLSKGAFNALLKTLEEPPAHAVFILATTEQHKVPATVGSRCQKFSFHLLQIPEIKAKLKKIAEIEKIKIGEDSLALISETAQGGMRDAESLFFQIVSLCGKKIDLKSVEEILGVSGREKELQMLKKIGQGEIGEVLEEVEEAVTAGADVFLLSHNLLSHLRRILFLKSDKEAKKTLEKEISTDQVAELIKISAGLNLRQVISLMGKIMASQPLIKNSSLPSLPLAIAFSEWILENKDSFQEITFSEQKNNFEPKIEIPLKKEKEVQSSTIPEVIMPEKIKKAVKSKKNKSDSVKDSPVEPIELSETVEKAENVEKKAVPADLKQFNIGEVIANWNEIIFKVRDLKPALFSLLKVCSPLRIEENTLVVATPYKFHKDKLNDQENKKVFCRELSKVTGLTKVCVIEDKTIEIKKSDKVDVMMQVQALL